MTDLRWRLRRRLRLARPVSVVTYRSYGSLERAFVRGRVIEDKGVARAEPHDPWYRNLSRTYRRMLSDEVPRARVAVRLLGTGTEAEADGEGFFRTWLVPAHAPGTAGPWHRAEVKVLEPPEPGMRARGAAVMVPAAAARIGVISDVDDTLIRADVARVLQLVAEVALGSAHTRVPFPGVAAFFRALHRGTGLAANPVFYVSNGPWNLYDLFEHFLELQRMPPGPVELRDWGPPWAEYRRVGRREHKLQSIRRILRTFPDLPFLLIGDSGEEDPEIYRDLVHEFPHRIPAVYIRDVSRDPLRKTAVEELAAEVSSAGSSLVLAPDTLAAARHAADHGWIEGSAVAEVAADRDGRSGGAATIVEGPTERTG